jgi:hypothetical protein
MVQCGVALREHVSWLFTAQELHHRKPTSLMAEQWVGDQCSGAVNPALHQYSVALNQQRSVNNVFLHTS